MEWIVKLIFTVQHIVAGYSEKHNSVVSFRVDWMAETPEVLKENSVPLPDVLGEDIEIYAYDKNSFKTQVDAMSKKIFAWIVRFEGKVKIFDLADVKSIDE